jgi:hypothetical protein
MVNPIHGRETEAGPVTLATLGQLADRRDDLYAELERRYAVITTTAGAKGDTTALEEEWVGLLREYERVCDAITEGAMTDDLFARYRNQARRILGIARCTVCGTCLQVAEDNVFEAREELRDEGWIESEPWDGRDETALTNWRCCE